MASAAVNKCFMHTNLLYLYKDPRGDGRPLPPFGRGDNLPKATLVERWGLNPWQGAPKGFNELLHSAASTEWSDLTSHSLANSLLKSRGGRFPFRKEALRWENWGGADQQVFDSQEAFNGVPSNMALT